jgi:hypothetical protein
VDDKNSEKEIKRKMKRIITILALVVLVVGGLTIPAFSADTGVVQVTAEVAQVSVTVTPDNVNYGLVPLNTTNISPVGDPSILAQNTGNCFVDMLIRGADTTNWALGTYPGDNTYVHKFGQGMPTPVYAPLALSNQDLGFFSSYSPGSLEFFKLKMDTPTTSSFTGTQLTTVTVMVTMETQGLKVVLEAGGPYPPGGPSATLTATVTDQDGHPVPGIPIGNFFTVVFPATPPGAPAIFPPTIWVDNGGGVYTGTADISSLTTLGAYNVSVSTNNGINTAVGGDILTIS